MVYDNTKKMYEAKDTKTINKETAVNSLPEMFLKDIVASGPAAVIVIKAEDLHAVFHNRQFEQTFGYTAEELNASGISFADLLDEGEIDRLRFQLQMVMDDIDARSRYTIYKLKYRSGERKLVYVYAAPLHDNVPGDKLFYHIMLIPDVSKWDLPFISFDTRDLFLEQFNKEGFGTFEWLMSADKVFWTKGIYSIYEVDDYEQTVDFAFAQKFVHPEDQSALIEPMERIMKEGGSFEVTYRIITAKQNIKTIHAIARVILDREGKPFKFLGSLRDITEQKHTEEDLKKHVEDLNKSNRELEEFAYVASHDLQEPLRKISTFSDRLSDKYASVLTGEGAMYLQRMMVSAENMRQLINSLLEFSRVSKSTQPFSPVNLNFVLHEVKSDLELAIEETGTTINSAFLPTVTASITQMKQLFSNIITNAIKFRKPDVKSVINIEVSTLSAQEKMNYKLLPALTYQRIQITDNGIGFESEYAERIFQVFQRLHGKSEYPGSGIGLAICKKIVEHHHGYIFAENIQDKGARFVIILPEKQPA